MTKLIICVDGLGKDLISQHYTPFLYKFGKDNYFSELETLFAFTGLEYSFFSGKNPCEHKIWLEFIKTKKSIFDNFLLRFFSFDKKIRDYLAAIIQYLNGRTWISGLHNIPKDKLKYFDVCVKEGLWNLPFFQYKNFVFYKWPFFVIKENNIDKIKIIFKYENDEDRLKRLLQIKEKDIYYTQLMSLDKAVHKFGKKNKEIGDVLLRLDKIIAKYVSQFLEKNEDAEVIIWADHGFSDIKNYINICEILPKKKDYVYFIAGTTAHFWFDNKEIKKEIIEKLKKIKNGKILTKKNAEKYRIPFEKKYGELIFFVKPGNYLFPNFYQKEEKFVSMHGYPNNNELNGFLISNKKIPKKLKIYEVVKYIK